MKKKHGVNRLGKFDQTTVLHPWIEYLPPPNTLANPSEPTFIRTTTVPVRYTRYRKFPNYSACPFYGAPPFFNWFTEIFAVHSSYFTPIVTLFVTKLSSLPPCSIFTNLWKQVSECSFHTHVLANKSSCCLLDRGLKWSALVKITQRTCASFWKFTVNIRTVR